MFSVVALVVAWSGSSSNTSRPCSSPVGRASLSGLAHEAACERVVDDRDPDVVEADLAAGRLCCLRCKGRLCGGGSRASASSACSRVRSVKPSAGGRADLRARRRTCCCRRSLCHASATGRRRSARRCSPRRKALGSKDRGTARTPAGDGARLAESVQGRAELGGRLRATLGSRDRRGRARGLPAGRVAALGTPSTPWGPRPEQSVPLAARDEGVAVGAPVALTGLLHSRPRERQGSGPAPRWPVASPGPRGAGPRHDYPVLVAERGCRERIG
jgi:hypothetical protein